MTGAVIPSLRIGTTSILLTVLAACGGGSEAAAPREPVSARVIVTNVQVSADGERVESIRVRTDDDKEIAMRLGDNIDPAIWGPPHLLSHAGLGKSLGMKIAVTYVETSETVVAIELTNSRSSRLLGPCGDLDSD